MGQLRTCWRSQNRLTLWARRDGLVRRCLGWGSTIAGMRLVNRLYRLRNGWWEHPPPKLPTPPASYPQLRDLSARHARVPLPAPPAVALFADLAQAWVTGRRDGRSGGLGAAVAARRCAALAAPSGERRPGRAAPGEAPTGTGAPVRRRASTRRPPGGSRRSAGSRGSGSRWRAPGRQAPARRSGERPRPRSRRGPGRGDRRAG